MSHIFRQSFATPSGARVAMVNAKHSFGRTPALRLASPGAKFALMRRINKKFHRGWETQRNNPDRIATTK